MPSAAQAVTPPILEVPAGLSIAEIKITGNEFILLYNNSGAAISDLSKYWIYSFNNVNPLAASVSSSSQQLPAVSLGSGQTVLLSANGGSTCGAAATTKLSVSLTDSGGFLEIVQTSVVSAMLVQTAIDAVSWSSGVNTTPGMITNVPSSSSAPNGAYYRYKNPSSGGAAYLWQQADVDATNSCQLNVIVAGVSSPGPINPGNQLLPGTPPPATIILADSPDAVTDSGLPIADIGLQAPQINELLPNPTEPQTDGEDEFIELYNSNDVAFDLTGFKLQTGTTTLHNYTFASGTFLPAKSFVAFYSIDTNLSLSNTSGQTRLLDPSGNIISQTEIYNKAPDGQAWALANGTWYWTMSPTASEANIINQPLTVKALSTGASPVAVKKSTNTSAATASTKTTATPKVKAATTTSSTNTIADKPKEKITPLHPLILAGVGIGAVGYAAYEYRNDLRNRFYQLRRYKETRRASRANTKSSRSRRASV